jgi:hypothetical protein
LVGRQRTPLPPAEFTAELLGRGQLSGPRSLRIQSYSQAQPDGRGWRDKARCARDGPISPGVVGENQGIPSQYRLECRHEPSEVGVVAGGRRTIGDGDASCRHPWLAQIHRRARPAFRNGKIDQTRRSQFGCDLPLGGCDLRAAKLGTKGETMRLDVFDTELSHRHSSSGWATTTAWESGCNKSFLRFTQDRVIPVLE